MLHLDPGALRGLRSLLMREAEDDRAILFTSSSKEEARSLGAGELTRLSLDERSKEDRGRGERSRAGRYGAHPSCHARRVVRVSSWSGSGTWSEYPDPSGRGRRVGGLKRERKNHACETRTRALAAGRWADRGSRPRPPRSTGQRCGHRHRARLPESPGSALQELGSERSFVRTEASGRRPQSGQATGRGRPMLDRAARATGREPARLGLVGAAAPKSSFDARAAAAPPDIG